MAGKRRRVVTSPHSKNACRTCRIRKVKCDETHPECKRCSSTGRKCDGYPPKSSPDEKRLMRALLPSQSPPFLRSPSEGLSINFATNNYERAAFNYFVQDTAWILRAVIQSDGWIELALQIAHEQPAVFQAVAAVGGIHHKLHHEFHHTLARPEPGAYQADAMKQYCRATVNLRKYLESAESNQNTSIEPVLLCCLLLACFEVYQGRGAVGLSHLRLGRQIVDSFSRSSGSATAKLDVQSKKVSQQLVSTFAQLEVASDILEPKVITLVGAVDVDLTGSLSPSELDGFESLEDAKTSLQRLLIRSEQWRDELLRVAEAHLSAERLPAMTRGTRYCMAHCVSRTVSINREQAQQRHDLIHAHQIWSHRLDMFNHIQDTLDCQVISLMRVKIAFSKFLLETALTTIECSIEENSLDELLGFLEQYIAGSDAPARPIASPEYLDPLRTAQRDFKLELTILPALSVCCLKSRSPERRQRAMKLISSVERREGIAWSPMLALYVQTIADLEQQAALRIHGVESDGESLFLPEAARFLDVVVDVPRGENQLRLVCGRYRHEDDGALDITILEGYGPPPFQMNEVERWMFPSLATGHA
ncbi:Hypothetical protein R9X50_00705600 [Acrodontium crateriforme]|uniref:Zn(2)-C6 fungal-type domain-containing protein n=1 Tax=Acrodontium crateriforme TaxID=150365 RepID=A0AAQ3RDY5_9PEZI|nr:Hypothetical protein R9X50_00705600 [Acrodontium crateriforme]